MKNKRDFQERLLNWFAEQQRDLPWRRTYAPYHVWISEIMLQQTQVSRVVDYFTRWLDRFPDVAALAAAHEEDVLKAWEGLGYYTRARNLHRAAQRVMTEHQGRFPSDHAAILDLPGIGPYTAGAIASLAFEQDLPIVDANVERVYARVTDIDTPVKQTATQRRLWTLAQRMIPAGQARNFNQALMELGALVCSKSPDCEACPVLHHCEALRLGITDERPVPGKKTDITRLDVATGLLVHNHRVFIQKRLPGTVWGGLWEFPGGKIEADESPEAAIVREFHEETGFTVTPVTQLTIINHGYTRYRIRIHAFHLTLDGNNATPTLTAASAYEWAHRQRLDELAFPAGHRKLIDRLGHDLVIGGLAEEGRSGGAGR